MNQSMPFGQAFRAFAGPMWMRHRVAYQRTALGLVAAVVCAYALPFAVNLMAGPQQSGRHTVNFIFPTFGYFVAGMFFLVCMSLALKVGSLFYMELGTTQIGTFTTSILVLPARTRELVALPMAIAIGSVVGFWFLFCACAVLPLGANVPILLPAIVLAMNVSASQTSSWLIHTKSVTGKRVAWGMFFMMASMFGPILVVFGLLAQVPQSLLSIASALIILLSITTCFRVGPNVRNSTELTVKSKEKRHEKVKPSTLSSFDAGQLASKAPTAFRSQLWFDQRGKMYLMLPFFALLPCVILLARIVLSDDSISQRLGIGNIEVAPATFQYLLCFPICAFFAFTPMPSSYTKMLLSSQSVSTIAASTQFVTIRPITSWHLIVAINVSTALGAFWTGVVLWAGTALWLLSPAREGKISAGVGSLLLSHSTPSTLLLALFGALAVPFLLWSFQFSNPAGIAFSKKVLGVLRFLGYFAFAFGFGEIQFHVMFKKDLPMTDVFAYAFSLGLSLVCAKAILAGYGAKRLLTSRLASQSNLICAAGIWALATAALVSVLYLLVPASAISLADLCVVVALVLPANRIIWQLINLDSVRHQ